MTTPVKRKRGEGQWALGYREPLNPNEQHQEGRRRAQRPGPHREHLRQARLRLASTRPTCAAGCAGGASTPSASPASTAAAPATLEPEELDDRVLHAAGALRRRRAHHRAAAHARRDLHDFARDTADISDRQNVQYHWIEIEDMPAIWQRLEAVGLQTTEACGDCPRVVLGSPVAGHRRRRGHRPDARDRRDRSSGTSATRSSPTCRASSRPRSRASRTSRTRSTTSRSSGSSTPSTAPASTCGSAAACPPTRCWPSGSAPGCRSTRCPRSGRPSCRSSATTATAGCATAPA